MCKHHVGTAHENVCSAPRRGCGAAAGQACTDHACVMQCPRGFLHSRHNIFMACLSIMACHAGGAGLGEKAVSTAAATATFRASTAGSPVASVAASRHLAATGNTSRASPPVNVVEILSRSPARSAAAARPGPAGTAQHTQPSLPLALEDTRLPQHSNPCASGRRAGSSGTTPVAGVKGGENAAPVGSGAGDTKVKGTNSTTAAPAQPAPGVAEAKAVRKGKWQSRKNTNAIFVSPPGCGVLASLACVLQLALCFGVVLVIEAGSWLHLCVPEPHDSLFVPRFRSALAMRDIHLPCAARACCSFGAVRLKPRFLLGRQSTCIVLGSGRISPGLTWCVALNLKHANAGKQRAQTHWPHRCNAAERASEQWQDCECRRQQ